jgi:hypothetical protein
MVETDMPQMRNTIQPMGFACCITKATNRHSEYVTLSAFPQQKSLRECALMLPYAYIARLVETDFVTCQERILVL